MGKYIDLYIDDDMIKMDDDGLPVMCEDEVSLGQDIIHAIRERGLLSKLIGERSSERRRLIQQQLAQVVEEDGRIIPGTVTIKDSSISGTFSIYADTYEFGTISSEVSSD